MLIGLFCTIFSLAARSLFAPGDVSGITENPPLPVISGSLTTDKVVALLEKGDADGFIARFDPDITIALPRKKEAQSPRRAGRILRRFFDTNVPEAFRVLHEGLSEDGEQRFIVGNLVTENGVLRTYVLLRDDLVLRLEVGM